MADRITPARVWMVLVAVFAAALVERTGSSLGFWRHGPNPNVVFASLMTAAYAASLMLCWNIARDHRGSPTMRLAWMLLGGSAVMSIIRHTQQAISSFGWFPSFQGSAAYVPTQIPMALALVLLFAGLLAMWRAFSRLGLGFRAQRNDIVLIILMLLMLPPILIRNGERLPPHVPAWAAILPVAGAVFLPACGAVALLLHRIAGQMQGGETARFLGYLVWFTGIRLVAMLVSVDPLLRAIPAVNVAAYAVFQVAPLVFTLALACRWQITVRANAAIAESEEDEVQAAAY